MPKEAARNSPAVATTQRPPSARVRQNSSQSAVPDSRQRAQSTTSNKPTNTNDALTTTADTKLPAASTSRNMPDTDGLLGGEANPPKDETAKEKMEVDPPTNPKGPEKSIKKEDTIENGNPGKGQERRTSVQTTTATTRKASKTSTPVIGTFPDSQPQPPRSRPSRTAEPVPVPVAPPAPPAKRSHKKGAGAAAQAQQMMAAAAAAAAAAARTADEEGSSIQGDDEDDEDETEPRYCYCNQVSYGEMVACDMATCPREWFHLDCVGLTKAPTKNG